MDNCDDTMNQCLMESTVRKEVREFMQACHAFAEFSQDNELTKAESEAIANLFADTQGLQQALPDDPPLAATLSNTPPLD